MRNRVESDQLAVIRVEKVGEGNGSGFDFGEEFYVGEVFEVVVLGPKGGVLCFGGGVDDGICHGEVVLGSEGCGELGNFCCHRCDVILMEEGENLGGGGFTCGMGGVAGDFVEADGGDTDGFCLGECFGEFRGVWASVGDFN